MTDSVGVDLMSRWRSIKGSEVLEVRRIWLSREGVTVRAHPVKGGRPLITSPEYLRENYERVADDN